MLPLAVAICFCGVLREGSGGGDGRTSGGHSARKTRDACIQQRCDLVPYSELQSDDLVSPPKSMVDVASWLISRYW